jgi:hypothetical protein
MKLFSGVRETSNWTLAGTSTGHSLAIKSVQGMLRLELEAGRMTTIGRQIRSRQRPSPCYHAGISSTVCSQVWRRPCAARALLALRRLPLNRDIKDDCRFAAPFVEGGNSGLAMGPGSPAAASRTLHNRKAGANDGRGGR